MNEVSAQTRAPQGIFTGVRPDQNATTKVDLNASIIEGYDSDVPVDLRSTIDPTSNFADGFSTMVNGSALFARRGDGIQIGAMAASTLRYYHELNAVQFMGHNAGFGLTVRVPGRISIMANQSAAYTPAYLSGLFPTGASVEPGNAGASAPDYALSTFASYAYTTTMTVRHDLTPRNGIVLSADYIYTDRLRETPVWRDVDAQAFHAQYWRNVGRNTALSAQYRYRSSGSGYVGEQQTIEHGLDVGFNRNWVLSASRRALLRFALGSSAADVPQQLAGVSVIRRQYRAVGDAAIEYPFKRTWMFRGNFRRAFEYVADLPDPVFANSVSAGLDGLLSRRWDLLATVGFSNGESAFYRDSVLFNTYTANVRMRYALSSSVAVFGEYLYYYYDFVDFRGVPSLRPVIPPGLERNAVRTGITLFVPALRR